MRPDLILGPLLRYAGERDATVWVETSAACEVEVRVEGQAHGCRTFSVEGHHYALVVVEGLAPGGAYEYEVALDGRKVWPEGGSSFPPSVIRTTRPGGRFSLAYGSCRVSLPHQPPYTLSSDAAPEGHGRDALYALAQRMREEPYEDWPDALLLLGDQIYADDTSPATREFIRSRRDPEKPPGEEIADFEEYTYLYRESWKDPVTRWLLSSVPSAMIFDDHDVNDDWNISEAWLKSVRRKKWWSKRITGAFMSYWLYQHLGNLSPKELAEDEIFNRAKSAEGPDRDATQVVREFARAADREVGGNRWSFYRDFGKVRLVVLDSRAGRVLEEGKRSMVDAEEWRWIEEKTTGSFDHLLLGTSLPFAMAPGLHHFEAASEAVCAGAWGSAAAKLCEKVRQAVDLEHWPAFHYSFERFADLLRSVAGGKRSVGPPPASVVILSGDVHHGYLARLNLGRGAKVPVYQAVGSPIRNLLGRSERLALGSGWTKTGEVVGRTLARLAGVKETEVRWRLEHQRPWFDNHISVLQLDGREARLKVEKTVPEDAGGPVLRPLLNRKLA